jgi:hypothetical protein
VILQEPAKNNFLSPWKKAGSDLPEREGTMREEINPGLTRRGFLPDRGEPYFPTRIVESEPMTPKTLNSQRITTITTTTFKIVLIFPSIGM